MVRSERGQSLVELALVLPLLILLLSGMVDLGRAFYGYISITNGAREGARYGARHFGQTGWDTAATTIAISEALNGGAPISGCVPTVATPNDWDGQMVRVTVSCTFTPLLWSGSLPPLQNSAAMKVEGS
jgi:Flp pilus assembly protein TadG